MLVLELLFQVIFHTDTDIDAVWRKETGLANVRILRITTQELRLELHVQSIIPLAERTITEVGVDTEHIITHFVIAQSVVRSRINRILYLQFIGKLDTVFIIIITHIFPVIQVQRTVSTFMPVRGDIVLCELDGTFKVGLPIFAFRDELIRSFLFVKTNIIRHHQREVIRNLLFHHIGFHGLFWQHRQGITETGRIIALDITARHFRTAFHLAVIRKDRICRHQRLRLISGFAQTLVIKSQVFRQIVPYKDNWHEQTVDDDRVLERHIRIKRIGTVVKVVNQ